MHPDLEKLIVLQGYDVEAKRLRDEMIALPKLVAGLEAKLKAVQGQRAVVVDLIAKEEALRRRQESDVKDQQAKIERTKKKIEQATTTAMVTAFEHEMTFAKGEIGKLEDAELESMERSEGLMAQKKLADEEVESAAAILKREQARAIETIALDKTALAGVEAQRLELRPQIGEDALSMLRPDREGQGDGGVGGDQPEMYGVPDDDPSAEVERPARPRQRGRDDDLRELRAAALLRPGAGRSAAESGSGGEHRVVDYPLVVMVL